MRKRHLFAVRHVWPTGHGVHDARTLLQRAM
jgi:hypothetical protein